jgi:hypothetical protein
VSDTIRLLNGKEIPISVVRHYLPRIAWRRETKIEQRGNFDEKYPEDVLTAFLVAGRQIFDKQILIQRKRELIGFQPIQVVSNGEGRIFHKRIPGRRYLIGADPATGRQLGTDDTDRSAAVVLDLETGEEMAAYRSIVRPEEFGLDLADLGRYFNMATIAVERTGDGGSVILTLVNDCRYTAIYKHRDWWKRERKVVEFEGFPTTTKTRPIAVNFLNAFVCEHPELVWDEQFIDEALVFVRDEKGVPKASGNNHDDTVSARWIAHAARRLLLGWWDPITAKREEYLEAGRITNISSAGTVAVS